MATCQEIIFTFQLCENIKSWMLHVTSVRNFILPRNLAEILMFNIYPLQKTERPIVNYKRLNWIDCIINGALNKFFTSVFKLVIKKNGDAVMSLVVKGGCRAHRKWTIKSMLSSFDVRSSDKRKANGRRRHLHKKGRHQN